MGGTRLCRALYLLLSLVALAGAADHYKVLGVKKSANVKEIRAAYRKLALELHPDKNSAADAAQKFSKVAEAWEARQRAPFAARRRRSGLVLGGDS